MGRRQSTARSVAAGRAYSGCRASLQRCPVDHRARPCSLDAGPHTACNRVEIGRRQGHSAPPLIGPPRQAIDGGLGTGRTAAAGCRKSTAAAPWPCALPWPRWRCWRCWAQPRVLGERIGAGRGLDRQGAQAIWGGSVVQQPPPLRSLPWRWLGGRVPRQAIAPGRSAQAQIQQPRRRRRRLPPAACPPAALR